MRLKSEKILFEGASLVFSRPYVLLDDTRSDDGRMSVFRAPKMIVRADHPDEVQPALVSLQEKLAQGYHVAGYFSYELGYLLEPSLHHLLWAKRDVPLLWFGIFERPEEFDGTMAEMLLASPGRAYAGPLCHEWDQDTYASRFNDVRELIAAGDIYEANLTFRSRFAFAGDPMALYRLLRTQARSPHCAYIDDGERQILSLSPELFFSLSRDGRLVARPMKGTAARKPGADEEARAALAASVKDRAENLMIVDLMRNDLGRIAEIGSVCVPELFVVETYPTVHQMVSGIEAKIRPGTTVLDIVHALFPCGSITGAPKIRAMEVIRETEDSARGAYCGAIGTFRPDGTAKFNVAIRTLTISGRRGELGVGGAIVYDSVAPSEYAECKLKARYYDTQRRPIELFETLRYSPTQGLVRLDRHLLRIANSADYFGIAFDAARAREMLERAPGGAQGHLRVRLSLSEDGTMQCRTTHIDEPGPEMWRFVISDKYTSSGDALLRHKTSWRSQYDDEQEIAVRTRGADEVLFQNERGELTEGSRTNIFVEKDGILVTPPLEAGVLNGCLRQELIDAAKCREGTLLAEDVERLNRVYLGNSLRGLIRAQLL